MRVDDIEKFHRREHFPVLCHLDVRGQRRFDAHVGIQAKLTGDGRRVERPGEKDAEAQVSVDIEAVAGDGDVANQITDRDGDQMIEVEIVYLHLAPGTDEESLPIGEERIHAPSSSDRGRGGDPVGLRLDPVDSPCLGAHEQCRLVRGRGEPCGKAEPWNRRGLEGRQVDHIEAVGGGHRDIQVAVGDCGVGRSLVNRNGTGHGSRHEVDNEHSTRRSEIRSPMSHVGPAGVHIDVRRPPLERDLVFAVGSALNRRLDSGRCSQRDAIDDAQVAGIEDQ